SSVMYLLSLHDALPIYADVGGFGFARTVDDAAHDGERHGFNAVVLHFPGGHHFADVGLGAFGEFLKRGARGAAAAGASGDARSRSEEHTSELQSLTNLV